MANGKSATKPARRRTSPLVAKLREQSARASARIRNVKAELAKSYAWPVKVGLTASAAGGGFVAGAVKGVINGLMGDSPIVSNGVVTGLGILTAVGGAMVPGAGGAALAVAGGGMLAKVAGDGGEVLTEGLVGGAE